jgi:hypothetical protein
MLCANHSLRCGSVKWMSLRPRHRRIISMAVPCESSPHRSAASARSLSRQIGETLSAPSWRGTIRGNLVTLLIFFLMTTSPEPLLRPTMDTKATSLHRTRSNKDRWWLRVGENPLSKPRVTTLGKNSLRKARDLTLLIPNKKRAQPTRSDQRGGALERRTIFRERLIAP